MNIGKAVLKLSGAQVTTSVLNLLALIYFARKLGPGALGIFFLFQSILGIVRLGSNLGQGTAIEQRLSGQDDEGAIISSALLLRLVMIVPAVVLIYVFRSEINSFVGADLYVYLILGIVVGEVAQFLISILKGQLRVGETAELQFIQQVIWVGVGVVFVIAGYGFLSLVVGVIAGRLAKMTLGLYKVDLQLGIPSIPRIKDLASLGVLYVLPGAQYYLYSWLDVLVIGFFLTQSHVGAYEIAWRVASVVVLFSKAMATSIFPKISSLNLEEECDRIRSLIPSALTVSYLIVVPAFFGLLVLSEEILVQIYGTEFSVAAGALIVLGAAKVFETTKLIVGQSLLIAPLLLQCLPESLTC